MIEPVIVCNVQGVEVTLRDRHWNCSSDLDLEKTMNDLYPMGGDLANAVELEVELVMAEFGGEIVAIAQPVPEYEPAIQGDAKPEPVVDAEEIPFAELYPGEGVEADEEPEA